jgi:hypothetical protein
VSRTPGSGSIRACAVTAAIRAEYRKLGRLLLDSEFGPFH